MSPISPRARTNLELILTEVEALCKEMGLLQRGSSRRGRPSEYSDLQIIQMLILQNLLGFNSQRAFIRFLGNLNQPLFNKIPDHSRYNRRTQLLKPQVESLTKELLLRLKVDQSSIRLVDATGIPLMRLARKNRRKLFRERKLYGVGYCASLKMHYFGLKMTLLLNQDGIPGTYHLMPANKHDNPCLEEMLIKKQNITNVVLVGDTGYLSDFNKEWFKQCWSITLVTPYRKNQKKHTTKKEKKFLKKRKIIETVIGQLKDQFRIDSLKARNYQSIQSQINNIIFTYIFGVYFNKKYHRNPLNLKSIIT